MDIRKTYIIDQIKSGRSLANILKDKEMPTAKTFYSWMAKDLEFARLYNHARLITPRSGMGFHRPNREQEKAEILRRLSEGEALKSIVADPNMPSRVTMAKWMDDDPQFKLAYKAIHKHKGKRPNPHVREQKVKFLERIAQGRRRRDIEADSDMPSSTTVTNWLSRDPDFNTKYHEARDLGVAKRMGIV